MSIEHGTLKGETCNRNECDGVIEHEREGFCSCHLNPPCSYCTDDSQYCPKCGWENQSEIETENTSDSNFYIEWAKKREEYRKDIYAKMNRQKPITEFQPITEGHTHFSQIVKGVYPSNMTRSEVREKVKGSFGGRFTKFDNGVFEFIAYTD